jgi:hypothetical protein
VELTILICTLICTLTSIVGLLPQFGIDLRWRGRSEVSGELTTSSRNVRDRRRWLAFGLTVLSVCLSAGAFYYFHRPRLVTVEKIVEKPVDRIVEKTVQQDCPKPKPAAKAAAGGEKISRKTTSQDEGAAFFEPIQVLLDCSPVNLPITIPSRSTAHVIALNKQANVHARFHYTDIRAEGRAPKLWPDSLMDPLMAVKCSVFNHGKSNLTDVQVPLEITYAPNSAPVTHSVYINPLDQGQTFYFYVVNSCPIETHVRTVTSGTAKVVGEDAPRQFKFERPEGNSSDGYSLNPGNVSWLQVSCE